MCIGLYVWGGGVVWGEGLYAWGVYQCVSELEYVCMCVWGDE